MQVQLDCAVVQLMHPKTTYDFTRQTSTDISIRIHNRFSQFKSWKLPIDSFDDFIIKGDGWRFLHGIFCGCTDVPALFVRLFRKDILQLEISCLFMLEDICLFQQMCLTDNLIHRCDAQHR